YLLILKGNQGRIAISSYLEESLPKIQDNIIQWFKDLDLGEEPEKRVSKGRKELLRSLIKWLKVSDDEKIPSRLSLELFLSVIRGSPLPRSILVMALERIIQEKEHIYSIHIRRLALLKAYLLKKDRTFYSQVLEGKQMNLTTAQSTEQEQAHLAFQLGRLFKLLTDVQFHATSNDGAVSKFYGMACSQTKKTFGFLLEKHQKVYLKKLKRDKTGLAINRDKRICELLNGFLQNENYQLEKTIPNSLSSEEKALFALGFYREQKEIQDAAEAVRQKKNNDTDNQQKGN
ncbi:MAG: type I-C CRISPR-associated protein Cas8c/Csd1, partial [Candidatus Caenarcaniphilales bacterium]|nr:type I-C CRISPR-associated protein Cas8c/Csd1 [Candidatus Caenarcaniphilales bacterium]